MIKTNKKRAIIAFSGGQDSTTILLTELAKDRFDEIICVSFSYGQTHYNEVDIAKDIIDNIKKHFTFNTKITFVNKIMQTPIAGSALTHAAGDVNTRHRLNPNLPASWVPHRNLMFLTNLHSMALEENCGVMLTGVCQADGSHLDGSEEPSYPDCTRQFIQSLNVTLNISALTDISIETPLMDLSKGQEWLYLYDFLGEMGVEFVRLKTLTCYNGCTEKMNRYGFGCDNCPSCQARAHGWDEFNEDLGYNVYHPDSDTSKFAQSLFAPVDD